MKICIFVPIKYQFWSTKVPPGHLKKKAFRTQMKSVFKLIRQSAIHMQDLKQIYFSTILGYEDLRETAT